MFTTFTIALVTILSTYQCAFSLEKLPSVEENDISRSEQVIRSTTNWLFSSLGLHKFNDNSKIKLCASIHKYFVSLTLQDHTMLKEIAKLTRVNKTNFDSIKDFIAIINEVEQDENDIEGKLKEYFESAYEHNQSKEIKRISFKNNSQDYADRNDKVLDLLLHDSLQVTNANSKEFTGNARRDGDLDFWHDDEENPRRIFNGKRASVKHFPFMASVHIFQKFECAGVIIKSDLILTAASCLQLAWNNRLFRENPAFLSVRVGSSYYAFGGEVIGAIEVIFHPGYDPKTLHHNIAIIRLQRKIKFKKSHVKKIDLDEDKSGSFEENKVTIVGWGAKSASNMLPDPTEDKLQYVELPIYSQADCRRIYSKHYVTHKNFCGGFMASGKGACNRDVGGPGLVGGVLVGIISFGSPVCGSPDAPTVFTKVGYYNDWIDEIIEQEAPWKYLKTPKPLSEKPSLKKKSMVKMRQGIPTVATIPPIKLSYQDLQNPSLVDFFKHLFNLKQVKNYVGYIDHMKKILRTGLESSLKEFNEQQHASKVLKSTSERTFPIHGFNLHRPSNDDSKYNFVFATFSNKIIKTRTSHTTKELNSATTKSLKLISYFLRDITRARDRQEKKYDSDTDNFGMAIDTRDRVFIDVHATTRRTTITNVRKNTTESNLRDSKTKGLPLGKDVHEELLKIIEEITGTKTSKIYVNSEKGFLLKDKSPPVVNIPKNISNENDDKSVELVLPLTSNENYFLSTFSTKSSNTAETQPESPAFVQNTFNKEKYDNKSSLFDDMLAIGITKYLSKEDLYDVLKQFLENNPDAVPWLKATN